jgi:hypothetical protein
MNILPQIRNPSALFALALAAPVVFLAGGNFHLPRANAPTILMDKSVTFDSANVGVIDELQAVQANLAGARRAMGDKDYQRAAQLADDARVDALVAERHAQSTHARKAAQDSQNDARTLRSEIAVKAPPQAIASN